MSNRTRRRRQEQKSCPWPILMFGGILLVAVAFVLALKPGAGSAGGADPKGPPKIAVDQAKIDYGYVKFGNDETFKIKVTNTGGGVLRFKDQPYIEVVEGC